jgi:spore protease
MLIRKKAGVKVGKKKEGVPRTDLALEVREQFAGTHREIAGVVLEKKQVENTDIALTKVHIETAEGAKTMGKPMGTYITLEQKRLQEVEGDCQDMIEVLGKQIKKLVPKKKNEALSVLVVGLGNLDVTADALGPMAVARLCITRHLQDECAAKVSSLIPGVMAKTGMETAEIIKGVVKESKPDVVVVIDSLAARSTRRVNTTIQITDTGIAPGSGVGNHRSHITQRSIGVPVIAVGVPTVVEAATIVADTMDGFITALGLEKIGKQFGGQERKQLVKELLEPELGTLYVTPKDIDETVRHLSEVIAAGINEAFSKEQIGHK